MLITILLLIIGAILIVLNVKSIKKEKNTFKNVMHEEEGNIKDFEIEIGKLRREFAETLLDIQKEVLELKESIKDKKLGNTNNSPNVKVQELKHHKKNVKEEKNIEILKEKINETSKEDINKRKIINKKEKINEKKIKNKENEENQEGIKEGIHNNIKINEIEKQIKNGVSVEKIADNLKISKGEILLIKELYLK